ncbi:MAG TPA: chitobiase/beta-hexosaminidase C-terminal domain-containing protein [Treponemataceae bacterium]|nr:chitobiase/beta-hexosaminidase C-terminal domain-containing protein [Treponemataceae bacterium]
MRARLNGIHYILMFSVSVTGFLIGCSLAFHADLFSVISQKVQNAPAPVITPANNPTWQFNVVSAPTVTLSCELSDARVLYSIDGAEPFTEYTVPFNIPFPADTTVPSTIILRAYARHNDYLDSAIASQVYQFVTTVPAPVIAPAGDPPPVFTIKTVPTVTIICAQSGVTIHVSLDGGLTYSDYTTPFSLSVPADPLSSSSLTVSAYATFPDYLDSSVSSQGYSFVPTVPTPTIDPPPAVGGYPYSAPPTITLSCSIADAAIVYSVDGLAPETAYSTPFILPLPANWSFDADVTVRAYATKAGFATSDVAAQTYHCLRTSIAPTIAPVPASYYQYNLPPTIQLTCPTAGATIHYSVDGGATYYDYAVAIPLPVPVDWSINRDIVLTAYASLGGYVDSTAVSATYPFLAPGTILTIAGNGLNDFSGDGGAATDASLGAPTDVCVDGAGNVYISDTDNNRIRKVDAATGIITTFAGTGIAGSGGDGGIATSAQLSGPTGLAATNTALYVADTGNNRIRIIDLATGVITTYAGTGAAGYFGDGGNRIAAVLNAPQGIGFDNNEKNLYIADTGNNRVRCITIATNVISLIAGNGTAEYSGDGALATLAGLNAPVGVGLRLSNKFLYIADTGNNRIRMIDLADDPAIIVTAAGTGTPGYSGDNGDPLIAAINAPTMVQVDNTAVYFSDTGNARVRLIDGGIITTIAGTGISGFSGDRGPATSANLSAPMGLRMTSARDLIVDAGNNRVRYMLDY